jgi:MOSC domain-containing protein
VKALWRFPVKSMLGEELNTLHLTARGVDGDRAWALRDLENRRIASAKKFVGLLKFRAQYEGTPLVDHLPPVKITLPDGRAIHADDPKASEIISEALGHGFHLENSPSRVGERAGIDPKTIFADNPVGTVIPGLSADKMPDYFGLQKGTYRDSATFHLIATGTLAYMRSLTEGVSDFDYRRFRANLLIDTGDDAGGFVEDQWTGGVLEIGAVKIISIQPALRCVMTTHAQQELPRDLAILRTTVQRHQANLGAFTAIEGEGDVHLGDAVYLVK